MPKLFFFLSALVISTSASAQQMETVYLNAADTTVNKYIVVKPQEGAIKGVLFLLDGLGGSPQNVLMQSAIPTYAAQQGLLTIIPMLQTGKSYFGSDLGSQKSLKTIVEGAVAKYKLTGKNCYFGGFSIGGTCVVKYAQLAKTENYPVQPKAVFAIDPPLDWERFYNGAVRTKAFTAPENLNGEVPFMIARIEAEMGGTPEKARSAFYRLSPYSFSDTTRTAAKTLLDMPLMLLSEPDIAWWMSQRGYDYSYLNITDGAALIADLHRLGNEKAMLVTTTDKGFREPQHFQHPHSWSIADAAQTVKWLLATE